MSISIPEPSISWYRVLPKPTALLHDHFNDPFSRRNSSLLQHHISSDNSFKAASDTTAGRRITVPSIAYSEPPRSSPPSHSPVRTSIVSIGTAYADEGPVTRKRAASLMEDDSQSRDQSPHNEEAGNQYCLCQPDPKIPRPRNAFILYRQHHQAAVVARHPGLPNPEISKILGQQWRNLPVQNKKNWQSLAEEEKARHQQQYPDYRYQPRRNNRNGQNTSSDTDTGSSSTSPGVCSKCGGKIMHPPITPAASGFAPMTPGMPLPQYASMPTPRRVYTTSGGQPAMRAMAPVMVSPPQAGRVRPYGEVFGGDPRVRYGPMPPTPMAPDPKRRRFNGNGVYVSGRGEIADSPNPYTPRKMSLPRPEAVPEPRAQVGSPPNRHAYQQNRHPPAQVQPSSKHDPSLVLPPLKTHGPSPEQRGGLAAMIMSLPVMTKVKMLALAAPQLATPGPASPPYEVRGAILAIEGLDSEKVRSMTEYLTEELGKNVKFSVKTFSGPTISKTCREDLEVPDLELRGPFEYFLETIGKWHKVSREMCKFITTKPGKSNKISSATTETEDVVMTDSSLKAVGKQAEEGARQAVADIVSPVSPRTIIPTTASLSLKSPTRLSSPDTDSSKASVPIAIVQRYQLTTVDVAAVSMAITDSYSPNDHWRWLASLWRGCVGPDITIVLRGPGEGAEGSGENWDSVSTGVEVRLQGERTVVVRLGKSGEIDEKALRRVGFEVEEYLRR